MLVTHCIAVTLHRAWRTRRGKFLWSTFRIQQKSDCINYFCSLGEHIFICLMKMHTFSVNQKLEVVNAAHFPPVRLGVGHCDRAQVLAQQHGIGEESPVLSDPTEHDARSGRLHPARELEPHAEPPPLPAPSTAGRQRLPGCGQHLQQRHCSC